MEKYISCKQKPKAGGVAVNISDKWTKRKMKAIKKYINEHYIMIKESIKQEDNGHCKCICT